VWTDYAPDALPGDFTGDGIRDASDESQMLAHIAANDGVPGIDDDGIADNDVLSVPNFPLNFSVYDTNYDGLVEY